MGTQDLDSILNGDVAPDAPPEVVEAPVETVETRPRDEQGRFAPKGDTEPEETPPAQTTAPPAVTDDEGPTVPRKALQDERSKRQALEEQVQTLQRQFQQFQNPPPPAPEPVSVFDDEAGWEQQFGQTVVNKAVNQATLFARMDMSEMLARQAHPDFADKKPAIVAAMEDPGLRQKALADPHPWDFAYNYVVNQERMLELSAVNVTDLEAKLRAKIEAEFAAKGQEALTASLPAGVPPSLSQERNVGTRQGPAWAGPAPLADLLNRR